MEKLKKIISLLLIVVGIFTLIYGIGYIKYKFWRAEHPQAKTWTFFIPRGK